MEWKSYLGGVITTLGIAVIGGVAVSYINKSLESEPRLLHYISSPAIFNSNGRKIGIRSITLFNAGNIPDKNIRIVVDFKSKNVKAQCDKKFSSGDASIFTEKTTISGITLSIPTLIPNEKVIISCLLEGEVEIKPDVDAKSDNSISQEINTLPASEPTNQNSYYQSMLQISVSILILISFILIIIFLLADNNKIIQLNRAGFTLLHQGMHEEAFNILSHSLEREGSQGHLLANLAVCHALKGEKDIAYKYIKAARFNYLPSTPKRRNDGFINFCEAIVLIVDDKTDLSLERLRSAIKQSKDIEKYIKDSSLIQLLRQQNPNTDEIFKKLSL